MDRYLETHPLRQQDIGVEWPRLAVHLQPSLRHEDFVKDQKNQKQPFVPWLFCISLQRCAQHARLIRARYGVLLFDGQRIHPLPRKMQSLLLQANSCLSVLRW